MSFLLSQRLGPFLVPHLSLVPTVCTVACSGDTRPQTRSRMAAITCGTSKEVHTNFPLIKLLSCCLWKRVAGPSFGSFSRSVLGAESKDCLGGSVGEGPGTRAKGVFSGLKHARTMSKDKIWFQTLGSISGAECESDFPESVFLFSVAFHPPFDPGGCSTPSRCPILEAL